MANSEAASEDDEELEDELEEEFDEFGELDEFGEFDEFDESGEDDNEEEAKLLEGDSVELIADFQEATSSLAFFFTVASSCFLSFPTVSPICEKFVQMRKGIILWR